MKIILASSSPRRKELLKQIGIKFIEHPSNFEEKNTHISPHHLVIHNAKGKAKEVAKFYKNALIIGVDTVVAYKEHLIGKPKNNIDAKRILKLLSNTTHEVITGVCVYNTKTGKILTKSETTQIKMAKISNEEIEKYIKTGEGKDKAGSFAIQGKGSLFIKKIDGDYFNVVGLPIYLLKTMLKTQGYKM
jgi:septum formation protein